MRSSSTEKLKHDLPPSTQQAHCYPGLTYRSLISVVQLCDAGYKMTFDCDGVAVVDPLTNKIGMTGSRNSAAGLCHTPMVPISKPTPSQLPQAKNVYDMHTKTDLAKYLHQASWIPVPHTWCEAIKNVLLSTFPGLTPQLVQKHLPDSIAT